MAHANARTTLYARKLIVDRVRAGHRPGEVAKQLGVSRQTVHKWMRRHRTEGEAGLADRSSRPHHMPRQTSPETTAAIVAARTEHHAGPVRLAAILGLAASTIGAVLARAGRVPGADTSDDRVAGVGGRAVVRVGHRDLGLKPAASSAATPSGGLLRDQGATPTVNNVSGRDT